MGKRLKLRDGMAVSCVIDGTEVHHCLIREQRGDFFICQNVLEGESCEDKGGYDYSWFLGTALTCYATAAAFRIKDLTTRVHDSGDNTDATVDDVVDDVVSTVRFVMVTNFGNAVVFEREIPKGCLDNIGGVNLRDGEHVVASFPLK